MFCSVTLLASCPKIKVLIPPLTPEKTIMMQTLLVLTSLSPLMLLPVLILVFAFIFLLLNLIHFLSVSLSRVSFSHVSLLSLFPSTLSHLVFQINPLPFLLLSAGSAGITAAAKCRSVLPAADAAAADQQRPAAEPGSCATGKGACTFFLTLPTCLRFSVTSILRMLAVIVVWDTLSS